MSDARKVLGHERAREKEVVVVIVVVVVVTKGKGEMRRIGIVLNRIAALCMYSHINGSYSILFF